jgi:hypothetical protein
MTAPRSTAGDGRPGSAPAVVALIVATVVAAATVAGSDTPCAEFLPSRPRCQFTTGFFPAMRMLCIGQVLLLSSLPVFISLVAAASSRWKSGAHLLTTGCLGALLSVIVGLFGEWPTGVRAPVHLLGLPVLASVVVLLLLWSERIVERTSWRRRGWLRNGQDFD